MNTYDTEEHGDKARPRHGLPAFYNLLQEMAETHDKKSYDYASDSNPSGNYHFAGKLALVFSHSEQDAGFVGRLGEKIYRLANLESSQKIAQNESIEDTELDCCVIMALWMADRRDRRFKAREQHLNRILNDEAESGIDVPEFDVRNVEQVKARSEKAQRAIIELYGQLTVDDTLQVASFFAGCRRDIESAQLRQGRSDNTKRL
jgi:hypothetical protein